jgi:hypothetical protein
LEKQRWEESEKSREEARRSEKSQKKKQEEVSQEEGQKEEDAGARKGKKVAKHCVCPMICGSGGSKSRLATRH